MIPIQNKYNEYKINFVDSNGKNRCVLTNSYSYETAKESFIKAYGISEFKIVKTAYANNPLDDGDYDDDWDI